MDALLSEVAWEGRSTLQVIQLLPFLLNLVMEALLSEVLSFSGSQVQRPTYYS